MTEYRASLDAPVSFSNGGDLAVHGFRVDVPSPDIDEAGIAALFVCLRHSREHGVSGARPAS
jgi:arylformamidase